MSSEGWKIVPTMRHAALLLLLSITACGRAAAAAEDEHLGSVQFPTSCNRAASRHMERGLALLHHMTYDLAQRSFAAASEADRECGTAYWGVAMTYIHPLWPDVIPEEQLTGGLTLVARAKATGQKTDRELAYIGTTLAYYEDGLERSEGARLASFAEAWRRVHESYPEDVEAAAFYSLAYMATAPASDKSYAKQKRAGRIAEQVLERVPDHPGGHHYVIHAYDVPPLAEQALEVARGRARPVASTAPRCTCASIAGRCDARRRRRT